MLSVGDAAVVDVVDAVEAFDHALIVGDAMTALPFSRAI